MPALMTPSAPELGKPRAGYPLVTAGPPATLPASVPAARAATQRPRPERSLVVGVCRALLLATLGAVGLALLVFGLVPVLFIALALFLPALLPFLVVALGILATTGGSTAVDELADAEQFQI